MSPGKIEGENPTRDAPDTINQAHHALTPPADAPSRPLVPPGVVNATHDHRLEGEGASKVPIRR